MTPHSDLPPNNPERLIEEMREQLGHPDVLAFLRAWSHGKVDIKLRISRREVVSDPAMTYSAKVRRR